MSAGEFVTETFDYDGGRQVTAYVPAVPPEAIVFAADGQMISQWGRFLEAADVPSTMIVGVHRVGDETLRLREYSPNLDPKRLAAHERFFVEDVGAWARSRFGVTLPAERTAVFRRVENSRLLLGCDTPSFSTRSSQPRPAGVTCRLTQCRVDCRARILWPERWNLSSLKTQLGGPRRCALQVQMSS